MKVGDTVKLKPAMWQGIKPESYGLSFTGEYIIEQFIDMQYPAIKLEGVNGKLDAGAFQLVKEKEVSKFKVGDKVVCTHRVDGNWYMLGDELEISACLGEVFDDGRRYIAYNVTAHKDNGVWIEEGDFEVVEKNKQPFKFKPRDIVYLSQSAINQFSPNNWGKYHLPLALYNGAKGIVERVEKFEQEDSARVHVNVIGHGHCFFMEEDLELTPIKVAEKQVEYTGGSSNYYKVFVKNPTTLDKPYEAECNDIIEALDMTFAEGNAFKAIWRKAKARQGVQKKGYDNGLYDSEKVVFFGERMVVEAKEKGDDTK